MIAFRLRLVIGGSFQRVECNFLYGPSTNLFDHFYFHTCGATMRLKEDGGGGGSEETR